METFFGILIALILTSWAWGPVLFAMSPVITLILVGVIDSIPFRRRK
jgi:predicted PurR-regulated permease PerM